MVMAHNMIELKGDSSRESPFLFLPLFQIRPAEFQILLCVISNFGGSI